MTDPSSGDFVQSFARGLDVIRSFDAEHAEQRLSDVAARTGMTRATARRFLHTLHRLGYVRTDGSYFALTPRILELGFSYLSALTLTEVVQPHLERLSREVDESVSAAVLDAAEVVYVARVPTRRIMSVRITIGTRFPAYVTSMGRVLLAGLTGPEQDEAISASQLKALTPHTLADPEALRSELQTVSAQGWALVDGELESGLRSIAAPIHGRDGRVLAAVNISTAASATTPERLIGDYLPPLLRCAGEIDTDLRLSADSAS